MGTPASPKCQKALDMMVEHGTQLGILLARHNAVGLISCLTFLGITVDTETNELRLPNEKLARLKPILTKWGRLQGLLSKRIRIPCWNFKLCM